MLPWPRPSARCGMKPWDWRSLPGVSRSRNSGPPWRSGDYTIAATRVGAAGNDAECFLMQWTSSSPDNVVGYSNSAYDT